jgi:uncharacterized membrane protein HdeD (DUF308 family)
MDVDHPSGQERPWLWLRFALGALTIAVSVAALTWPEPTVRVIGVLFGVNLIIIGLVRAVLSLVATMYPVLYRIAAVVLGVLTAVLGVICLRHLVASAVLLILVVGIGWLLDGVPALAAGIVREKDPMRGWRFGIGTAAILTAVGVFIWPALSLDNFVAITAVFFVAIGTAEAVAALATLCGHRSETAPTTFEHP